MIKKKETEPNKFFYQHQPTRCDPWTKMLMWFGVLIFSLIIVFLWGWALKIKLDNFSWKETPENKIISTAKTNWDEYFNEQRTKKQMEENKNKIKEMVGALFLSPKEVVSSSPATTTP